MHAQTTADQLHAKVASIQTMVKFLGSKAWTIVGVRALYTPEKIPKWVGDFSNTKDYRGYLHSIGVALPEEKGGDVPMEGSSEGDEDHSKGAESPGDNDVTEEEHVDTPSTSVANHTQSQPLAVPQGTSVTSPHPTAPALGAQKPVPESVPSEPESAPESAPLKKKSAPSITKSAPEPQGKLPVPLVKAEEEPLPGPNINERVRSGEATLEEKPTLIRAHQVVAERIGGSQAHNPNVIQQSDGSLAEIVERSDGTKLAIPVKNNSGIVMDDVYEQAISEITTQEVKMNSLALMKKARC